MNEIQIALHVRNSYPSAGHSMQFNTRRGTLVRTPAPQLAKSLTSPFPTDGDDEAADLATFGLKVMMKRFSNGFERSNLLNLGGNAGGQASLETSCPTLPH